MQGAFEKAYGLLNQQQKLAVDTIDGPVLVIAGPGTGKTQLLTTRIANILHQTDVMPANILCLTFTDSAAITMRERLITIIGQAAYDITISTYHAFGSDLIRRHSEYFMNSADLRPVDDLTIDAIFRDILSRLPYSNPLRHDVFLRDIKSLISDAKRALLTPKDLRKVAEANETFIIGATKNVQNYLNDFKRLDKKSAPLFEKILAASQKLPADAPLNHVSSLATLWYAQLETAVAHWHETGKTTALTQWKNLWLAKDGAGKFVATGEDTVRKLRAAATIYEQYLTELTKLGLYDYDDMILRAIRGLETHPDLRYTLQEQYLYMLLDEFQDTNQAQTRLVELLTDSPVHEGRPNVMAVGDDDQAIYAFQGADYSHMLNFTQRYKDVVIVPLTANYRSTPEILQLADGIASQIETRLHHYFPGVTKTITSASQNLPVDQTIERIEFKSDLSQNAWVSKKIQKLIQAGVPAHEIAVLAPKHEYLEALVPFLHHTRVPIRYDRREDILDDSIVNELVLMTHLILALHAKDTARADNLWPEVLSARFWKLSTEQIWKLSWEANDTHTPWADVLCNYADTKAIALFFIRLSQLTVNQPLEPLLDMLIGTLPVDIGPEESYRSPFYEYYFGALQAEGNNTIELWGLLSNLTVLRQRLREYRAEETIPLRLDDFIKFIEAHRAAGIKILNTNPYQEAAEAVQLMTAYKAKGQEFAAVFILAAQDEIWGSKARNVGSRLSLPENLRFMRYAGTTEDERLRLLYVAVTRARSQLYIASYTGSYTGRLTTRLKYLQEYADEAGQIISSLLPEGKRIVRAEDQTPPELAELTIYWQGHHASVAEQPKLQALLRPRLERYQLSATHLNCFTDVTRNGPATFFTETLLRFPTAHTPAGEYGNAVHETLEWLHVANKNHDRLPSVPQMLQYFEKQLRSKRLGEPHTSLLLERGRESLARYIEQRSHTINAHNFTEYNFRNEGVIVGEAHLGGKIDKLIINSKQKTLTIVDYKTGKSYQRWAREPKLHAFKQQLYFYKLLVERSHTFGGYTVEDAYLEFVEPDIHGQIQELHITFEDSFARELEQLIGSVWHHIMELRFPDVSGYTQDLKGIEVFQHDLINNTV